jgi:plastocyanin
MRMTFAAALLGAAVACGGKSDAPPADSAGVVAGPPAGTVTIDVPIGGDTAKGATAGMTRPAPGGAVMPAPGGPPAGRAAAAGDLPPIPPEDLAPVVASSLPQVDTTITMRAHGAELIFDPQMIVLKQGTRVRIRFVNSGTFAHNFVLVKDPNDIEAITVRAQDARDHVPMSMKAKLHAWSKLAQPSQTAELEFVVPPAGEYMYVCFVESHANTMTGTLKSIP